MSTKLFVGGLPWAMDNQRLKEVFAEFGGLEDARVILDRETGRSRGFGFVTFADDAGAEKALALDGREIDGRPIRVDRAQEKERPARGRPPAGAGARPPSGPPAPSPDRDRGGDRDRGRGGREPAGRDFRGDDWGEGGGRRGKGSGKARGRRRGGRGARGGGGEGSDGPADDFDDY